MGLTIGSKRYSCDMGYGGFGRFRNTVAEQVNDEFHKHYLRLSSAEIMFLCGEEREKFFKEYDADTRRYIDENEITEEVANFLYQSDREGKVDRNQARQVYELIKDCDDSIMLGYAGKDDCAKMGDMKAILSDKTKVEWM